MRSSLVCPICTIFIFRNFENVQLPNPCYSHRKFAEILDFSRNPRISYSEILKTLDARVWRHKMHAWVWEIASLPTILPQKNPARGKKTNPVKWHSTHNKGVYGQLPFVQQFFFKRALHTYKEPNTCTEKPWMWAKEPYVYSKEPYISAKEPYTCTRQPYIPVKEPLVCAKNPGMCSKEPYISAKESYVSAKEPSRLHTRRAL